MTIHKLFRPSVKAATPAAPACNITLHERALRHRDARWCARAPCAPAISARVRCPSTGCVRWSVRRKVIDVFDDLALDAGLRAAAHRRGQRAAVGARRVRVRARARQGRLLLVRLQGVGGEPSARRRGGRAAADALPARSTCATRRFEHRLALHHRGRRAAQRDVRGSRRTTCCSTRPTRTLGRAASPNSCARTSTHPKRCCILLGPPGGGKTRLVREILAAISRRKGENAEIMYTTDKRALASDEHVRGVRDRLARRIRDRGQRPCC